MFQAGNTKLGQTIWTWSIPSIVTCPGSTAICRKYCYAAHIEKWRVNVRLHYEANHVASLQKDFAARACEAVLALPSGSILRVHAAGDYYDADYASKWLKVMRACPEHRFYFYTRSWREADIRPVLVKMSRLRNVRAWWSVDCETGWPLNVPRRVRLAYMQTPGEEPLKKPDLVFRVMKLRRKKAFTVAGSKICPVETGGPRAHDISCEQCKLCWKPLLEDTEAMSQRLVLEMV